MLVACGWSPVARRDVASHGAARQPLRRGLAALTPGRKVAGTQRKSWLMIGESLAAGRAQQGARRLREEQQNGDDVQQPAPLPRLRQDEQIPADAQQQGGVQQ